MRIGTWNVENRLMSAKHEDLLVGQACDVPLSWKVAGAKDELFLSK